MADCHPIMKEGYVALPHTNSDMCLVVSPPHRFMVPTKVTLNVQTQWQFVSSLEPVAFLHARRTLSQGLEGSSESLASTGRGIVIH